MSQDVFNARMLKLLCKKDEKEALIKYYKNTTDAIMDAFRQNQIASAKQELQYLNREIVKLRRNYNK